MTDGTNSIAALSTAKQAFRSVDCFTVIFTDELRLL